MLFSFQLYFILLDLSINKYQVTFVNANIFFMQSFCSNSCLHYPLVCMYVLCIFSSSSSFTHSFMRSFICSFIHSIRYFIYAVFRFEFYGFLLVSLVFFFTFRELSIESKIVKERLSEYGAKEIKRD